MTPTEAITKASFPLSRLIIDLAVIATPLALGLVVINHIMNIGGTHG